jgi:hypothetical protein
VAGVDSIRIEKPGAPAVVLRRTGPDWSLAEPPGVPADPRRVRELLAVPELPVLQTVATGQTELARFELDPPLATLVLGERRFSFGAVGALGDGRYVGHGGRVHLVPDTVFLRLSQGAGFFVEPALIRPGVQPVRIEMPGLLLAREGGVWRAESAAPAGTLSQPEVIAAAWQTARAVMVRVGIGELSGRKIAIGFESGAIAEFELVVLDGRAILLRPDLNLEYHLDPETATALQLLPAAVPMDGDD